MGGVSAGRARRLGWGERGGGQRGGGWLNACECRSCGCARIRGDAAIAVLVGRWPHTRVRGCAPALHAGGARRDSRARSRARPAPQPARSGSARTLHTRLVAILAIPARPDADRGPRWLRLQRPSSFRTWKRRSGAWRHSVTRKRIVSPPHASYAFILASLVPRQLRPRDQTPVKGVRKHRWSHKLNCSATIGPAIRDAPRRDLGPAPTILQRASGRAKASRDVGRRYGG